LRDSYRSALRGAGFAAVGTEDGFDALKLAEIQRPSAIVLDFVHPRLNARIVQEALKANPHTRDIPLVVVSGADVGDLNLDEVACLLKEPVNAHTLVVAVQHVVRTSAHRPGQHRVPLSH
jgi:CheY-like chemotaxis protein